MKPAPFEYVRPANIDEDCALLAAGDGARLIAGGQTLVPLMAMRLARPTRLIDIARIPALSFVREEGDAVAIGAATRQCVVENDPLVRASYCSRRSCHISDTGDAGAAPSAARRQCCPRPRSPRLRSRSVRRCLSRRRGDA